MEKVDNIIKVGMAELKASIPHCMITTLGLGSCVGVALYDTKSHIVGLAHVMLPTIDMARDSSNKAKYADTAIQILVDDMLRLGASQGRIIAKIAGGAQMFAFNSASELMKIGLRNVEAVKDKLEYLKIPIVAEDVGGTFGRTIELYSTDGSLLIKTIGHGIKVI